MQKTLNRTKEIEGKTESIAARAVDAENLAEMLGCGRATAVKIGRAAGARIQIGRRVLYKVSAVDAYLEQIAGQ